MFCFPDLRLIASLLSLCPGGHITETGTYRELVSYLVNDHDNHYSLPRLVKDTT